MRIDHVASKQKTSRFFIEAFGYKLQQEFTLDFGEGKTAQCIALEPPEKIGKNLPWMWEGWEIPPGFPEDCVVTAKYHMAPEIFVSDGSPGSIVGDWVAARGGVGGIHHIAYQVDDVEATMREWQEKGYAEFTSEKPITCPGLTQVFTKPSALTGVIFEFITRGAHGFCAENVKALMLSGHNDSA